MHGHQNRKSFPKETRGVLTARSKRWHLDDLPIHVRFPCVLFSSFPRASLFRTVCTALEYKANLRPSGCQWRLAPKVLAGFGRREPYHAFWFLQVGDNNLKPGDLTRPREQIRPTTQQVERTRERFSAYRPANPPMNFSRILSTVGMISSSPALANRTCATKSRTHGALRAHGRNTLRH